MAEWVGPDGVEDSLGDRYGWCWSKLVEHRGEECELIVSIYDDEDASPDLLIYHPNGYESFAYTGEPDPTDEELREWAEEMWDDFIRSYDYMFDE